MSDQPQKNINSAVGVIATGLNLFGLNKKSKNEDQINKNSENIKKNKDKLTELENTIDENKNKIEKIIKETKKDYFDEDDGLLVQMENKIKEEFKRQIDIKKTELIKTDIEIYQKINDESYRASGKYSEMEKEIESHQTKMETDYSTLDTNLKEKANSVSNKYGSLTETLNTNKHESMENEKKNMNQGRSVYYQYGKQNTVRISAKRSTLNEKKILTGWLWKYNNHLYVVTTGREWEENIYRQNVSKPTYDADAVIYNTDTQNFQHFHIKMCSVDFLNNVSLFGFVDVDDENKLKNQGKGLHLDSEIHKGERCYLVGEFGKNTDHFSITSGIVRDDNFTNTGNDSVLIDMVSGLTGSFGSPFLNKNGKVIGMKQNSTLYFPRFDNSFTGDINKGEIGWSNSSDMYADNLKMETGGENTGKPEGTYLSFTYFSESEDTIPSDIVNNSLGLRVNNMEVYSGGKIRECKEESSIDTDPATNLINFIDNVRYNPNMPDFENDFPDLVDRFSADSDKTLAFLFNPNISYPDNRQERYDSEFIVKIKMETDNDGNKTFVFTEFFCYKSRGTFSGRDGFGCLPSNNLRLVKFDATTGWTNVLNDNIPITINGVQLVCWFEGVTNYTNTIQTIDNVVPAEFLTPMINYDINGTYKYKLESPELGRLNSEFDWMSIVTENKTFGTSGTTSGKNFITETITVPGITDGLNSLNLLGSESDLNSKTALFDVTRTIEYDSSLNTSSDWLNHISSGRYPENYNLKSSITLSDNITIRPKDFNSNSIIPDQDAIFTINYGVDGNVRILSIADGTPLTDTDFFDFMEHNDDSNNTEIPNQDITYYCQSGDNQIDLEYKNLNVILRASVDSYPGEVSFQITDSDGKIVFGPISGPSVATNYTFQLQPGSTYTLQGYDSYGDGWQGTTITIEDTDNDIMLVDNWTLPDYNDVDVSTPYSSAEITFTTKAFIESTDFTYPAEFTGKFARKEVEYETYTTSANYQTVTYELTNDFSLEDFPQANIEFYAESNTNDTATIDFNFLQFGFWRTILESDITITNTKSLQQIDISHIISKNQIMLSYTPPNDTTELYDIRFGILNASDDTLFEIQPNDASDIYIEYLIELPTGTEEQSLQLWAYGTGGGYGEGASIFITDDSGNESRHIEWGNWEGREIADFNYNGSNTKTMLQPQIEFKESGKNVSIYGINITNSVDSNKLLLDRTTLSSDILENTNAETLYYSTVDSVSIGGSEFGIGEENNIYTQNPFSDTTYTTSNGNTLYRLPFTLKTDENNTKLKDYYEVKELSVTGGKGFEINQEITIIGTYSTIVLNQVNGDNGFLNLDNTYDNITNIEITSYSNTGKGYTEGDILTFSASSLGRLESNDLSFHPLKSGVNLTYFPKLTIKLPDLPIGTQISNFYEKDIQKLIDTMGTIDIGLDSNQNINNSVFSTPYNTINGTITLNRTSATSGTFGISSSILEKVLINMTSSEYNENMVIHKNLRLKTRYNMSYILPEEINSLVQKNYMDQTHADYILGKSSITINGVSHYHVGGLYMSISDDSAIPFYIYDRKSSNIPVKEKDFVLFRVKYSPNDTDPNYSGGEDVSFPIGTFNNDCKSLSSIIQFINQENITSLEFHGLECSINEYNVVTWQQNTKTFTIDDIEFSDYHDLQYVKLINDNVILN